MTPGRRGCSGAFPGEIASSRTTFSRRQARGGLRNKSAAVYSSCGSRAAVKNVCDQLSTRVSLRSPSTILPVLHLLSPFRQPAYSGSSASSDSSCTSPVSPFQEGQASASAPCARHTIMYIDILPVGTPEAVGKTSPPMWLETGDVVHASERPRHLASINPTVTFMSLVPVAAQSRSTVYSEDRVPVHADTTPLTPVVDAPVPGFLYSTTLVPEYWKVISESPGKYCSPSGRIS
jgi:hypothetical protein